MICEINYSVLVADGAVVNAECVVIVKSESDGDVNISGEALVSVLAVIAEFDLVVIGDNRPPYSVTVFAAAVKTGFSVFIESDLIFLRADFKLSAANSVCILTDCLTAVITGVFQMPL